jgi:hypothetical protein
VFQFPVPRIDDSHLLVLIASVVCFVKAVQMERRSPVVWSGMSLGLWIAFTQFLVSRLVGGVMSQVLLFAGLGRVAMARDRDGERQQGGSDVPSRSETNGSPGSSDPSQAR